MLNGMLQEFFMLTHLLMGWLKEEEFDGKGLFHSGYGKFGNAEHFERKIFLKVVKIKFYEIFHSLWKDYAF